MHHHQLIIVIGGVGARPFIRHAEIMGVYLSRHGMENHKKHKMLRKVRAKHGFDNYFGARFGY